MPDETSKRCVPFHPWMIGKFKKSPISAAQCLLAAAEDSHECFIRMLANVNEAFPLPVAEIGQTNAKCEAGNIEAPKDAPSHKSLANFEVAAPLEGTLTGERFLAQIGFADSRNYSASELGPLLEAYAAAVSKARREELDRVRNEFVRANTRSVRAEARISELERELATLRQRDWKERP